MVKLIRKRFVGFFLFFLAYSFAFFSSCKNREIDKKFKVAFPNDVRVLDYDPIRISLAPEYIFLENIYSPLVDISNDGKLIPAIANTYIWEGADLVFEIKNNLKTVDGYSITAEDVKFSFLRIIEEVGVRNSILASLLCSDTYWEKNKNEKCNNFEVMGNKFIIKFKKKLPYVLPVLTSIEYAVIPKNSVNSRTMKIEDYRNTSGPYYVEKISHNGNIILRANTKHFNYSLNIPQEIELVLPRNYGHNSITAFDTGVVDMLTTVDQARPDEIISYAKDKSNNNFHRTFDIRTYTLVFTDKGMSKTSIQQRLAVGDGIRQRFMEYIKDNRFEGYNVKYSFFSTFGEAGLSENQEKFIKNQFKNLPSHLFPKNLHLNIIRIGAFDFWKRIIEPFEPKIEIYDSPNLPEYSNYKKQDDVPDMFITGPDVGWMEDVGLTAYTVLSGFYDLEKDERQKWLNQYFKLVAKDERNKKLNELHYSSLVNGKMVPLSGLPYVAIVKKPWKMTYSSFFANNKFWLIRMD